MMKMRHKKMARAAYRSKFWPYGSPRGVRVVRVIERWERQFRSVR